MGQTADDGTAGGSGRLAGRRCLVTGAASGLGRTFCQVLAGAGASVAGVDVADLSDAARDVEKFGMRFVAAPGDVTDPVSAGNAVATSAQALGGLDVLVNNAGVYPLVPFGDTDFTLWRYVMSVNLDGLFLITSAALPFLRRSPAGRIVNIASAAVWLGPPGMVAYTASKSGMIGFTRALASELGPEGITVNAITPGMIPTQTAVRTGVTADLGRVVEGQAIPRAQRPDDLSSTLLYLCEEASGFITGAAINVDGGFAKH